MSTRASPTLSRLTLAVVVAACAALAGTPGQASVATAAAARPTPITSTVTLTPGIRALSDSDIGGTLRGAFRWDSVTAQPPDSPVADVYARDPVSWGQIERARGVYDFTRLDDLMAQAEQSHGIAGLRVMAFCPDCATDPALPPWLPLQPGLRTPVPDWNSETFLSAWEQLMGQLGQRYGDDPRLGYLDVGGYGRAGAWQIDPASDGTAMTETNRKRLVTAVATAFPRTWVLINTTPDADFTRWVLDTYPHTGMRIDHLGASGLASESPLRPPLQGYWTTRPVLSEWTAEPDFALATDQVRRWHVSTIAPAGPTTLTEAQQVAADRAAKAAGYRYVVVRAVVPRLTRGGPAPITLTLRNDGSAPTYQPWTVTLQLRSSAGTVVASAPTTIDLRRILPGSTVLSASLTPPVTVPRGTYQLTLIATDPCGYQRPLALANTDVAPDGAVQLGAVTVS